MLAATSEAAWPVAIAAILSAFFAAAASVYTARRSSPRQPAPPPAADPRADSIDDELVGQLWRETLARLDELGVDRDSWRHRAEVAEAENLDLLRRLARGDGTP